MPLVLNGTNGVSGVDGSAGTPALRGTDADSGVYFTGSQVGFSTNGAGTTMTMDANGNVTFPGTVVMSSPYAMRNKIINGAMEIDQRNAGASVTSTSDIYCVDRWAIGYNSPTNAFTAQQSTTVPANFKNSLLITAGTGVSSGTTGYAYMRQTVEGLNVTDFGWGSASAKTITLSFWVRSSLTGTFGLLIRNSAADRGYGATYTINSANTFEYKTVTIAGDTSGTWLTTNGIGLMLFFDLGVGSTYSITAGSWQAATNPIGVSGTTKLTETTGATFYITGVQLEVGSVATPFERRFYQHELMLCMRYFENSNASGGVITGTDSYVVTTAAGTNFPTFVFKVGKRTSPTLTTVYAAGTGAAFGVYTSAFYQNANHSQASTFGWTASAEL